MKRLRGDLNLWKSWRCCVLWRRQGSGKQNDAGKRVGRQVGKQVRRRGSRGRQNTDHSRQAGRQERRNEGKKEGHGRERIHDEVTRGWAFLGGRGSDLVHPLVPIPLCNLCDSNKVSRAWSKEMPRDHKEINVIAKSLRFHARSLL